MKGVEIMKTYAAVFIAIMGTLMLASCNGSSQPAGGAAGVNSSPRQGAPQIKAPGTQGGPDEIVANPGGADISDID